MSHDLKPVTGQWYRHLDKGQTFRVVSVERDERDEGQPAEESSDTEA